MKSGGKGGGTTTNLINHLKRNHAANEDVKLALGKIENDNKKNQQKLSMPSSLSPLSSSTSMPIDMDLSDNESNLTSVSLPAPSLSESEKKFCYSERQPVLQPKIDSAFKKINSFEEGGIKCHPFHDCQRQYVFSDSRQ